MHKQTKKTVPLKPTAYLCDECGYWSNYKSNFTRHILAKHNNRKEATVRVHKDHTTRKPEIQKKQKVKSPLTAQHLSENQSRLDPELEAKLAKAFSASESKTIFTKKFGFDITGDDIRRLNGTTWLNDSVVNFYFKLIEKRSQVRC